LLVRPEPAQDGHRQDDVAVLVGLARPRSKAAIDQMKLASGF